VQTPQDEEPEDETEVFTISIDHTPSAFVPIPKLSSEVIEHIQENASLRDGLPTTFHTVETNPLPDYQQYANFWVQQSQHYKNKFLTFMGGKFFVKLFMTMFPEGRLDLWKYDPTEQLIWEEIHNIPSERYYDLREYSRTAAIACRHWNLHAKDGMVDWKTFSDALRRRIIKLTKEKRVKHFDISTVQSIIQILEEACQVNKTRIQIL